ncbi:hypothetical protein F4604DRAFT_448037 [Suillus subluteus]|nr:hypothetical protein F4604DRAFT_448037 [Suillus subluteus]
MLSFPHSTDKSNGVASAASVLRAVSRLRSIEDNRDVLIFIRMVYLGETMNKSLIGWTGGVSSTAKIVPLYVLVYPRLVTSLGQDQQTQITYQVKADSLLFLACLVSVFLFLFALANDC